MIDINNCSAFDRFFHAYVINLDDAMQSHPSDYGLGEHGREYSPHLAAITANSMRKGFLAGTFNKDGCAVRMTCRELGIKHTYKAIAEFFSDDPCTTEDCSNPAITWRGDVRYCDSCADCYDVRYGAGDSYTEISAESARKLGIT